MKKIIISVIAFLLLASFVNAISIGISPGRVRFDGVLRAGYAERVITITTGSDEDLIVTIRPDEKVKEWTTFSPNATTFTVSKSKPYRLTIIAQPPEDLQIGNYSGAIEILSEGVAGGEGRAGASVKTAVSLLMNLEISGTQVIKCRAGGFTFIDTEVGFPLEFSSTVINDGNVRMNPTITVDVWDQDQQNLLFSRSVVGDLVLPTTQKRITRSIPNTLKEGQYWVDMKVDECGNNDLKTFTIVERGGIVDKGELVDLINKNPRVFTNETVQVIAKFQNSGTRSVNAKFKGAIRLDDKIVQLIETEEILVPSGEMTDFDLFFNPQNPGRFTLSGRVIYNKKLTFEKGTIINVSPTEGEEKKFGWLPLIIYIALIMSILFLWRKIRHEKRRRRRF